MIKRLMDELFKLNTEEMYLVLNEIEDEIVNEYR